MVVLNFIVEISLSFFHFPCIRNQINMPKTNRTIHINSIAHSCHAGHSSATFIYDLIQITFIHGSIFIFSQRIFYEKSFYFSAKISLKSSEKKNTFFIFLFSLVTIRMQLRQ